MADLRVDYAALDLARTSLQRLAAEFEGMETRRDEMDALWVGNRVRKSMRGFADDWDRHRRDLLTSIHELDDKVATVTETFRGVDAALAQALVVEPGSSAQGCS